MPFMTAAENIWICYGKFTYAIGANVQAARVSGINVEAHLVKVYAIAGMLAGLAGVVTAARAQTAQAGMGVMYELDAIAATVIGGTSLTRGVGRITGTVIGTVILGVMRLHLPARRRLLPGSRQGAHHHRRSRRRRLSPERTQEGVGMLQESGVLNPPRFFACELSTSRSVVGAPETYCHYYCLHKKTRKAAKSVDLRFAYRRRLSSEPCPLLMTSTSLADELDGVEDGAIFPLKWLLFMTDLDEQPKATGGSPLVYCG